MANVSVYNIEGKEVGTIDLNDAVFGVGANTTPPPVHCGALVEEKKFIVVDEINFDEIKTKKFQDVLNNLSVSKALVVLEDGNKNAEL